MSSRRFTSAKGPTQRQLRVGEVIRHAVSDILVKHSFSDPALTETSVTISEVRPSPDMRKATVFCTTLGGDNLESVLIALNKSAGFIQSLLGKEIALKFTPKLTFVCDESFDNAEAINNLLQSIDVARDLDTSSQKSSGSADSDGA